MLVDFSLDEVFSGDGSKMSTEQRVNFVVGEMGFIKISVGGMTISSIGVTIHVDNIVIHIVLELSLLVVIFVTIGERVRISFSFIHKFEHDIHMVGVDWIVFKTSLHEFLSWWLII